MAARRCTGRRRPSPPVSPRSAVLPAPPRSSVGSYAFELLPRVLDTDAGEEEDHRPRASREVGAEALAERGQRKAAVLALLEDADAREEPQHAAERRRVRVRRL